MLKNRLTSVLWRNARKGDEERVDREVDAGVEAGMKAGSILLKFPSQFLSPPPSTRMRLHACVPSKVGIVVFLIACYVVKKKIDFSSS